MAASLLPEFRPLNSAEQRRALVLTLAAAGTTLLVALTLLGGPTLVACQTDPRGLLDCVRKTVVTRLSPGHTTHPAQAVETASLDAERVIAPTAAPAAGSARADIMPAADLARPTEVAETAAATPANPTPVAAPGAVAPSEPGPASALPVNANPSEPTQPPIVASADPASATLVGTESQLAPPQPTPAPAAATATPGNADSLATPLSLPATPAPGAEPQLPGSALPAVPVQPAVPGEPVARPTPDVAPPAVAALPVDAGVSVRNLAAEPVPLADPAVPAADPDPAQPVTSPAPVDELDATVTASNPTPDAVLPGAAEEPIPPLPRPARPALAASDSVVRLGPSTGDVVIELPPADALAGHPSVETLPTPAGHAAVQRGDTLWGLAHRTYGRGIRYWTIYRANRDQLSSPRRIYPGQLLDLPLVYDD